MSVLEVAGLASRLRSAALVGLLVAVGVLGAPLPIAAEPPPREREFEEPPAPPM